MNEAVLFKFSTTPRPFVTVQMGRTITIAWVLFLPFVIAAEDDRQIVECIALVFIITYGFMGLTLSEVELHDPLGNDPNDLETARYTSIITSDIKACLEATDDTVQQLISSALENSARELKEYGSGERQKFRKRSFDNVDNKSDRLSWHF